MNESKELDKKEEEIPAVPELPVVDYSALPPDIDAIVKKEQYTVEKKVRLTWDGKQYSLKIPSEVTSEMKITNDNRILFRLTKPLPGTDEKPTLEISLI